MKSSTRSFRGARKLDDAMTMVGRNTRQTGDLVQAASQVVAQRMGLGAAAMMDPLNADHVEFAKIVPEKAMAFSEAGMAWILWSGKITEQMASFAAREMAVVTEATMAITHCRTPAGMAAAQTSFITAWISRALSQSIALSSLAIRS
ncbi:MAG: hypothetical protein ABWY00_04290, partial [Dongiaceae bacterium]